MIYNNMKLLGSILVLCAVVQVEVFAFRFPPTIIAANVNNVYESITANFLNFPIPVWCPAAQTAKSTKIINGEDAVPEEFPFQCGLYLPVTNTSGYFCGCTLVQENVILTAAHCCDGLAAGRQAEAILGAWNITDDEPTQQIIKSKQLLTHPQWNPSTIENDLCLIELENKAVINDAVQVVNMSTATDYPAGTAVQAIGWGLTKDTGTTIAPVLQHITVTTVSRPICGLPFFTTISDKQICTCGLHGGVCNGDSGSALLNDKNEQIGLASFVSAAGCQSPFPDVFTFLEPYEDWITTELDAMQTV